YHPHGAAQRQRAARAGPEVHRAQYIVVRAGPCRISASVADGDRAVSGPIQYRIADGLHRSAEGRVQRAALNGGANVDCAAGARGRDIAACIIDRVGRGEVQYAAVRGFEQAGVDYRGAGTLDRERVAARVRVNGRGVVQVQILVVGTNVRPDDAVTLDQDVVGQGVVVAVGADQSAIQNER